MKRIVIAALLLIAVSSLPVADEHGATVPDAQAVFLPESCIIWDMEGGDAWLRFCLHDLERMSDPEYVW